MGDNKEYTVQGENTDATVNEDSAKKATKFFYDLDEIKERYKNARKKTPVFYVNLVLFIILFTILIGYLQVPMFGRFEISNHLVLYIFIVMGLGFFAGIYFDQQQPFFGISLSLLLTLSATVFTFIFAIYPQTISFHGNPLQLYGFFFRVNFPLEILGYNFLTIFVVFAACFYVFRLFKK